MDKIEVIMRGVTQNAVVVIIFFSAFLFLGNEWINIRHQKDFFEKSNVLLESDASRQFMGKLIDVADRACGVDDVCLNGWVKNDLPKYVNGNKFNSQEKELIEEVILKMNTDARVRKAHGHWQDEESSKEGMSKLRQRND